MYLASAYPNSALSALTMMAIGLVVAASLALWLGLVFLADQDPHPPKALSRESKGAVPSGLTSEERSDEGGRKTVRGGARR
jgi:hypothetical protein